MAAAASDYASSPEHPKLEGWGGGESGGAAGGKGLSSHASLFETRKIPFPEGTPFYFIGQNCITWPALVAKEVGQLNHRSFQSLEQEVCQGIGYKHA